MNKNYDSRQQKIYVDYASLSDEKLLDILENKRGNYIEEVIDVLIEIMEERGKLPDSILKYKEDKLDLVRTKRESMIIRGHAVRLLFEANCRTRCCSSGWKRGATGNIPFLISRLHAGYGAYRTHCI